MSFVDDLREGFADLSCAIPTYEEVLAQVLHGLLAKEHMLWFSLPGRAKSMMANYIFGMFPDASLFVTQITKDMMKEQIFGNPIPDVLMATGREELNLDGGIIPSVFAYLDEFFDGPDFLLRALNGVMNEREMRTKDMGRVPSSLHSLIATTNYLRLREATQAVLDRIMCKAVIIGPKTVTERMRAGRTYLATSTGGLALPKLSYADLLALSEVVQASEANGGIAISSGMRLLHLALIEEFQKRRVDAALQRWLEANPDDDPAAKRAELELSMEVTPRMMVRLHDLSRASAALRSGNRVEPDDQRALGFGLYVVNDGSGDDRIWSGLCEEWLPGLKRSGVRSSLETYGDTADAIGQLAAERSRTTRPQIVVGGQLVEGTSLAMRGIIDGVRRTTHPVLDWAKRNLHAEVDALDALPTGKYDLLKGWVL